MAGRLTATAARDAVDLHVPGAVSGGALDVTAVCLLACTAAHAPVPGDAPPPSVGHPHPREPDPFPAPWVVRCGANGTVTPVAAPQT
ncbi:hypothetical protein ACIQCR_21070 [Streptomyces sp. NPDC093249]|uniref:hypothetical protein n=1 Tax=unclassified Streptomyces TaxID=2593676 RepID=UPI00380AC2FA